MASSAAAFTITQSIGDDVDDKAWRQLGPLRPGWFAQGFIYRSQRNPRRRG